MNGFNAEDGRAGVRGDVDLDGLADTIAVVARDGVGG